jgi:hypothetical protein
MIALGICLSVGLSCTAGAAQWEAFQFRGNERYEYLISWLDQEDATEATYILDIQETGEVNAEGEQLWEVSYTTKGIISGSQLGPEAAFGLWSVYGVSLNALVLNPAYGFIFAQMDLKVGEKTNLYGAGLVTIPEKQTIAGHEGYVCQFFQGSGGDAELIAEWVIDPDLALPLSSRLFDAGEIVSQVELVQYECH